MATRKGGSEEGNSSLCVLYDSSIGSSKFG
jgi:hypothetical protein